MSAPVLRKKNKLMVELFIGANIARRWIDLEQVDAIADVPTSSAGFAMQEIFRQRNRSRLISFSGSSDATGQFCSLISVHWIYGTYALSHAVENALLKRDANSCSFLTADYAFGVALQRGARAVLEAGAAK